MKKGASQTIHPRLHGGCTWKSFHVSFLFDTINWQSQYYCLNSSLTMGNPPVIFFLAHFPVVYFFYIDLMYTTLFNRRILICKLQFYWHSSRIRKYVYYKSHMKVKAVLALRSSARWTHILFLWAEGVFLSINTRILNSHYDKVSWKVQWNEWCDVPEKQHRYPQ